jgi:hypothetical protein
VAKIKNRFIRRYKNEKNRIFDVETQWNDSDGKNEQRELQTAQI